VYQSTLLRFERSGDRVVPLRIVKAWVCPPHPKPDHNGRQHSASAEGTRRRFIPIRSTIVAWPPRAAVEGAPGAVKVPPMDRARLIELGLVKPAGVGACLELDERAREVARREMGSDRQG
jgi:hypothetical protein